MKATKIFLLALGIVTLSACSDDFLTRYPDGSTILPDQYNQLDGLLEGTTKGIYSSLYEFGGDHDVFGKRSIDMYGDILCGDMAMASSSYGWFQVDEMAQTRAYRGAYIWSFYYNVIRLTNLAINAVEANGRPELPAADATLTSDEASQGFYFGQILALRGYAYAGLMQYYVPTADEADYVSLDAIPLYDETDTEKDAITGNPKAKAEVVYQRIEADLKDAIDYLEAFGAFTDRASKLEINADVARGILANAYLNWGGHDAQALEVANKLIDAQTYTIIPNSDVLTNGFNDTNDPSWLWGQDVTIENTTALASFFGQVDIHSYSYAWAGDVKGVDEALLKEITDMKWDIRKHWWFTSKGNADGAFAYAPTNKFFSATSNHSTEATGIDRDWLSDNVFMRIESLYLIAAEASLNIGVASGRTTALDSAVLFLDAIMSQRLDTVATAATDYAAYKTSLAGNANNIKSALIYNWRTEMWGEGYGLQTFRRIHKSKNLGKNHLTRASKAINSSEYQFTFDIPSSENRYNQHLNTEELANKEE